MRRKIAAGNWKLNTNVEEGVGIVKAIADQKPQLKEHQRIIFFPPYTHLYEMNKNNQWDLGAQNVSVYDKGAFTGEVSIDMIKSCGAGFIMIGHSERRSLFNENYDLLKQKTDMVSASGMEMVFCCGETLEERDAKKEYEIVKEQLVKSLFQLSKEAMKKVIIAYEPVWAIGTGKTATPDQAQDMHAYIRSLLKDQFDEEVANETSILYGGSVNGGNAEELFAQTDIDGGLVGGASLKPEEFFKIISALP